MKSGNYTKQPLDWKEVVDHIRVNIYDPELQLFAATALVASTRVGEIIEVRVKDVTGEYILIKKTKCRIKNGVKRDPYRQVAKPEWYDKMLTNFLKYANLKPSDFLFQNSKKKVGGQLSINGANYRVKMIFEGSGINLRGQNPTMHTLRKTGANHLYVSSGYDLSIPNTHLGHASIANTAKYLNNVFEDYASRAKQLMA